jgi:hypothetical protein
MKIVMNKFLFLSLLVICSSVNLFSNSIYTQNIFQSEFEWLSTSKVKLKFHFYRSNLGTIRLGDSLSYHLKIGDSEFHNIGLLRPESAYLSKEYECTGLNPCWPSKNPCSGFFSGYSKTCVIYSATFNVDTNWLVDTLSRLNACHITFFVNGITLSFSGQPGINFFGQNIVYPSGYYSLTINTCISKQQGDKSPEYRNSLPTKLNYMYGYEGIKQLDFGCDIIEGDSVVYQLASPIDYQWDSFAFNGGYSYNYYMNSYCRNGAPCAPRPELNPPQGFSFNNKTGIATYYFRPPIVFAFFYIDIYTYKTINGKKEFFSLTQRALYPEGDRLINLKINTPVYYQNFPLRKYACANKADTLTIRLRDTMAVNQTIPDTIAYQVFQNLPDGSFYVSQPGTDNIELKIAWNPANGKPINNPYLFNISTNEQRCWPGRDYEFRSCEFYVIQMPEFAIQKTMQNCGRLELKAVKTKPDDNAYNYEWILTHSSGAKINLNGISSNTNLPKSGKWYISLKTTNTPHGCSGTFLDSIELPFATPKISVTPQNKVCQGQTITYTAQKAEVETPLQYLWQVGNQTSTDSVFSLQVQDSFKVKLSITDNRGCIATDSFEQKTFPFYYIQKLKDIAVCIGQSIIVSATPNALQDSVLWLHNNSNNFNRNPCNCHRFIKFNTKTKTVAQP